MAHLVMVKVKVAVAPPALAKTAKVPATPLAVSAGAVAEPLAFVARGIGGEEANVPLAPFDPGKTVNVTLAPLMSWPAASVTRTSSRLENAWRAIAVWPFPLVSAMAAGVSPLCVMAADCPNTSICAVRLLADVLARNEKLIAPPLVAPIVSQGWLLVAVRGALAGITCTGIESVPADEVSVRLVAPKEI